MAHPDEILEQQYRTLDRLKPITKKYNMYLAGGTALAFYLRHRVSRDLDLFSKAGPAGFPVAGLEDLATMKISAASRWGIRRDF